MNAHADVLKQFLAQAFVMTNRKPDGVSWESYAEHLIRQAQAAGEFDDLPGFGKPLPDEVENPRDEHWWAKNKLRSENLSYLPPGLQIRVDLQQTLSRLWGLTNEEAVRAEIEALNARIAQANCAVAEGPASTVGELDVGETLAKWRSRRGEVA